MINWGGGAGPNGAFQPPGTKKITVTCFNLQGKKIFLGDMINWGGGAGPNGAFQPPGKACLLLLLLLLLLILYYF